MSERSAAFRPALVIVDLQEDFCPPNGSLAVAGGREVVDAINKLLKLPFTIRIATKDFHPPDHISFASNHLPPDNKPFESIITIENPLNPNETQQTRLWPDHCVQGTFGSQLISELNVVAVDRVTEKGQDKRVEMYSAFRDPFDNPCISQRLTMDYCVRFTAIDAVKEGFATIVVQEGTRPVDPGYNGEDLEQLGVAVVSMTDKEIAMLKDLQ